MTGLRSARFRLSATDVQLYRFCENFTEAIIYFQIIFSPWAFGTTQRWSIWTMNVCGFLVGALLFIKLGIRYLKGYGPLRWDSSRTRSSDPCGWAGDTAEVLQRFERSPGASSQVVVALAALTFAILAYCLVSACNARATYNPHTSSFTYHERFISWLPHSFDSAKTWFVFWNYLALACSFWAIRDWLLGYSTAEERALYQGNAPQPSHTTSLFPARLRRLLWILSINGALLGLEGIVQRFEGSGKLLFFRATEMNAKAEFQFGPYHYRSNAAQYFNLVWPLCVGFWWTLQRGLGSRRFGYHIVLVCGLIMAACPMISSSRSGALAAVGILLAAVLLFMAQIFCSMPKSVDRIARQRTPLFLSFFFAGALGLGGGLGWKALEPRLQQLGEGFDEREEMYRAARPMGADYPLFGTGPGSFESVFGRLYRRSTEAYWPAQLHNDWLETRITFGWSGSLLIAAALLVVLLRWFVPSGIHGGRRFTILIWLSLAGCLLQARFDFPFQVYSILFLFLVLCAIVFSLSRRAA